MFVDDIFNNFFVLFLFVFVLFLASKVVHVNNEWEEAMILRFGKYHKMAGAGLFYVIPFVDNAIVRSKQTRAVGIEKQSVITKDNVPVSIDAVSFIKINDVKASVINVSDVFSVFKQYAQTTLRNIVGVKNLDELLSNRHEVAQEIQKDLETVVNQWGIDVERLELQDISLPGDMQRIMARQAEAEREKRGVIIASEGELEAAMNLKQASDVLAQSEYGFKLRQLSTISDISQDQSNTVVFYPSEGLDSGLLAGGLAARIPKPKQ
jgi:regulator of protease activity HflC (stomatin/prohibitin superfamily)